MFKVAEFNQICNFFLFILNNTMTKSWKLNDTFVSLKNPPTKDSITFQKNECMIKECLQQM